jgi:hypothetical protein
VAQVADQVDFKEALAAAVLADLELHQDLVLQHLQITQ